MEERTLSFGNIPAIAYESPSPRGSALLLHGLRGSKETHRAAARALARAGFYSVAIDAVGHGARRFEDWEQRFTAERGRQSYYEIVQQTAAEIPSIIAQLAPPLAIFGVSMGGAIAFGAINAGVRFDAASMLVASPNWHFAPESPHEHPERFFPTPLLIQTAALDKTVPPNLARSFHETLIDHYRAAPERLRYVEYANEDHALSNETWRRALKETVDWFEQFAKR